MESTLLTLIFMHFSEHFTNKKKIKFDNINLTFDQNNTFEKIVKVVKTLLNFPIVYYYITQQNSTIACQKFHRYSAFHITFQRNRKQQLNNIQIKGFVSCSEFRKV